MFGIFYAIGKKYSYSQIAVDLLFKAINSKINGTLVVDQPILRLKKRFLNAFAKDIKLLDENGKEIFVATNVDIVWSLKNLFNPGQSFKNIHADFVMIKAIRYSDATWNYSNILKTPSDKKIKYSIANLDLPKLNLEIHDEVLDSHLDYKDVSLNFQDRYRKQIFRLRANQDQSKKQLDSMSSNYILDLSNSEYHNLVDIDSVVYKGSFFNNTQDKHRVRIINLDPINIQFLISLIDFGERKFFEDFTNKYLQYTQLTLVSDLNPEAMDGDVKLNLALKNVADLPHIKLNADMNLKEDLLLREMKVLFDDTALSAKGTITKWRAVDPGLDLNSNISGLNIRKLRNSFAEIERMIPDFFLDMLNSIHESNFLSADVKISSNLKNPLFKLNLPIITKYRKNENNLKLTVKYVQDRLLIEDSEIPMEFSALKATGYYLLDESDYDLRIFAEDLPMPRLRNLFMHLPILHNYQSYLISPVLSGYTSFDVNIKPKFINGIVKIAKADYFVDIMPLRFKGLAAETQIDNNKIDILTISGNVDDSYFEAKAKIELNPDPKKITYELELASPSLNSSIIQDSKLLDSIEQLKTITKLQGNIDEFSLSLNKRDQLEYLARMQFDGVSFDYDDKFRFKNIFGSVLVNKKNFQFDNLQLVFNDSLCSIDGTLNKDFKSPKLKVVTKDLSLVSATNLIEFYDDKRGLSFHNGFLNASFEFNGELLHGTGSVRDLDFIFREFEMLKYPFFGINSEFAINKDIQINNLRGSYASSDLQDSTIIIKNYKSPDKSFELNLVGSLVVSELEDLMPSVFSKYISTKGALPFRLNAQGNAKKSQYEVWADAHELENFCFANWLELDNRFKVKAHTKFTITPQLIYSDIAHFESSMNNVSTTLDGAFQVFDWRNSDQLHFTFNTSTLDNGTKKEELGLIAPHIIPLKSLNIDPGKGTMNCNTSGDIEQRQTVCRFFVDSGIAHKYAIGDLSGKDIRVDLVSATDRDLDLQVRLKHGDWNGIEYNKVKFDLKIYDETLELNNLKANLPNYGNIQGRNKFNFNTLESEFFIRGNRVSANQLVHGIWGLGDEVPEGRVSGVFFGRTQGLEPEEMFFNMVATSKMIVTKGKLSSLKSMQRILSAVNTLKNFDFNNVFQTLITYKGGVFNYLISILNYDLGKISSDKVLLKADEIELNLSGFLDYNKDLLKISGEGLIPKKSSSILSALGVGEANLGNLLSVVNPMNVLSGGESTKNFFEFQMNGPITDMDKTAYSVKSSFRWKEQ